ncbi:MAG: RIP metalloprotease RseP [Pseudomonadota bacterium]
MSSFLISTVAFLVAIGVLVTVHEFGHFWVARKLGVKVLRFSIGFGQPLWSWRFGADNTELVLAAIPLGGYVKMLDERDGEVAEAERDRAFNRQPLSTRISVVVAGPLFNFVFAILAYWVMFVSGVPGLRPVVGEVIPASYAEQAGFRSGDEILAVDGRDTPSWETAVLALLDAGLTENMSFQVQVQDEAGAGRNLQVVLDESGRLLGKGGLLENFGLKPWRPAYPAIIERLVDGGPGERAGMRSGDQVISADGTAIADWGQLVEYVRARPGETIEVEVDRDGTPVRLELTPDAVAEGGESFGRIGAYVRLSATGQHDTMRVVVRYGPLEAIPVALGKTWEMSALTLQILWKMVTGKASIENLSGPISIARYAGQTAVTGLAAFLGFMAIVSVSLGVLNLLPIPILDGGHLLYYLLELVKGSPVSEAAQLVGQRIGIVMLLMLMTLAFYNDLTRLFG